MTTTTHPSYCRLCEALCGIRVTVTDGRVERIEGDREHPVSKGFLCPKGSGFVDVQNDPDRVLEPLRRRPDGTFEPVSWDTALGEIATRMRSLLDRHGPASLGYYVGNPAAFASAHLFWLKGLFDGLGATTHQYNTSSQDGGARLAASALLYGTPFSIPLPDVDRTDLLLILGANPVTSMGSVVSTPRIRERMDAIVARGGRVVVVDPRRTMTARRYEHVPIRPDQDAWLLLAMLREVLRSPGRRPVDPASVRGVESLRALAEPFTPEAASARTGIAPSTISALAADFGRARGAVAYGRTGTCTSSFGTLTTWLIDALNAVTGNLDRPGGAVFGWAPIALDSLAERFGMATYDTWRSPDGFPEVMGTVPTTGLASAIETEGPHRLRGLLVAAGNPVLSAPQGARIARALRQLEVSVSVDCYLNETGRQCDFVLPAASFLEREDVPIVFVGNQLTPTIQLAAAVVPPSGGSREEWEVYDELARRLGLGAASNIAAVRWLGRRGVRLRPNALLDLLLRTSRAGDWFGVRRGGLSFRRLRRDPRAVVLRQQLATGVLRRKVRHRDRRVHLDSAVVRREVARLVARQDDPAFPLRLIGRRELRSLNSWLHNAARLARHATAPTALVNPLDASAAGVGDGDLVRLTSRAGTVTVPVRCTDDVGPGTVAYPHGWGHNGGWHLANRLGGASINELASDDPDDVEPLAGMSRLNGIPVSISPVCR